MGANGTQNTNNNTKQETKQGGGRKTEPGNNRPQKASDNPSDMGKSGTMRDQGNDRGQMGTPAGKKSTGR